MNRAQFMEELERLLSDISQGERQEALDYYENYFEDAGADQEDAVIRELGSPGKVAAIIKADLREHSDSYAEYTEKGYEDSRTREPGQVPERYHSSSTRGTAGRMDREERARRRAEKGYHAEKKRNNGTLILMIILLVFLSPFITGAVGGVLGVIVALALLPFLLIFGLGAAALGLFLGGIACGAAGIGLCFTYPAAGILTIGIGCLLISGALLSVLLLVWLAGKVVPKMIRKFTDLCSGLLHRERKDGASV